MTRWTRREALLAGLAAARGGAAAQARMNFIVVLVDDMGWRDLGCQGSDYYDTPHIDRLAREGARFTDGYAACPVCSPTRASVMTGKYPARLQLTDWIPGRKQWPAARLLTPAFRQQLPLEETTIAELLRPAGYATASIGKWHLGAEGYSPEEQGFDRNVAGTVRGSPASFFGPFDLPNLKGGSREDSLTERLTEESERFLEQNKDRPFFLYLPEFAVHLPLQAREKAIAKYKAKGRADRDAIYGAMVESVDEAVGRLRAKLAELGMAERTVLLFTSDNGGLRFEGKRKEPVTDNAPLRAGKGHLYEGGIRVPWIVYWPAVTRGATVSVPVSTVDILPTVMEMAGLRAPRSDGESLVPLLRGSGRLRRDALYWHYPHYSNQGGVPGGAVREGGYKLIEFYEDDRVELYDLREDIGERRNLARKLPGKAAAMRHKLAAWRASVGAAMPRANPGFDPAGADQGLVGVEGKTEPV